MDGKHANGVLSVEKCQCADLIEFELSDCSVLLSIRELFFSTGLMSLQPLRVLRCLDLGAFSLRIVVFMRTCVRMCMFRNSVGQFFVKLAAITCVKMDHALVFMILCG